MSHLKVSVRRYGVVTAMVLVPLVITIGMTLSPRAAHAATTSHPACQASQIVVSAGATSLNSTYSVRTSTGVHYERAYEVVPVYFYNRGDTCHLLMGAPAIRAVRDTTDVTKLNNLKTRDLSVPAGADNTRRPVVTRHQRIEALFVIVKPVGRSFKGCDPATSSGLLVQGYANPVGTFHFVVRRLRDVCFDSAIGPNVLNYGVSWPSA